jgi:hypothetical protein
MGATGCVLVSAYLCGAVARRVRVRDPFLAPAAPGVVAWLGLWLRDERALFPLRR